MTTSPANLAIDTAVTKLDKVPGRYRAQMPDHWSYKTPSGGALMTVALRAMREELAQPELQILSATTVFCSPVLAGNLLIDVQVLRRGASAAQVRASLMSLDRPEPGLEVIATFAKERPGPDVLGVTMPEVPRPRDAMAAPARRFDPSEWPFPFYRNLEMAQAIGDPMWKKGWKQGPAHTGYWYRYLVPQTMENGELDPLAIPPIADTMPSSLTRKLGPDHPRFLAPSLDLTVYFLTPTKSEWFLVEAFSERARAGFAVSSANVWDEQGQLVARATQSMTLRLLQPKTP